MTSWTSLISKDGLRVRTRLLAAYAGDDLVLHRRWGSLVAVELHRVRRATLGPRTQVANIAEHLGQRYLGPHDLTATALLHAGDVPAPAIEVADDVTHVVLGRHDFDRHDRLQQ